MKKILSILLILFQAILIISCRSGTDKGEMLIWSSNNSQEISYLSEKIEQWNSANPDRQIRFQPIPEGQSSEEIILASVVGGTTPAIYANMWQGNIEMYAQAGVLIRLDTMPGFIETITERCSPEAIKEITSADGHIYQVPWKVNPIMMLYNVKIFQEVGLEKFPRTYQEYMEAAGLISADKNNDGYFDRWICYTTVQPIWYQRLFNFYPLYLAASNGASLIENNRAAFNNQYAFKVFAFLQDLYNKNYLSRQQMTSSQDPFIMESVATLITGPWEVPYLEKFKPPEMEYEFMPMMVPEETNSPVYTYGDPKNIVIFNTCSDPLTAWEFLRTLISEKGDFDLLRVTGQFPRRKNISTNPVYESFLNENPKLKPFAMQADYIKGVDNHPQIVEVFDIISQEYEACVLYGRKTPEKAVKDAADAVNVLLNGLK
ncbi:MAG: extracellular solute-binding protein [Bacteroidetes bacterium]|nr:extracellular solute-binding protein [Bacteroidota bacterium]